MMQMVVQYCRREKHALQTYMSSPPRCDPIPIEGRSSRWTLDTSAIFFEPADVNSIKNNSSKRPPLEICILGPDEDNASPEKKPISTGAKERKKVRNLPLNVVSAKYRKQLQILERSLSCFAHATMLFCDEAMCEQEGVHAWKERTLKQIKEFYEEREKLEASPSVRGRQSEDDGSHKRQASRRESSAPPLERKKEERTLSEQRRQATEWWASIGKAGRYSDVLEDPCEELKFSQNHLTEKQLHYLAEKFRMAAATAIAKESKRFLSSSDATKCSMEMECRNTTKQLVRFREKSGGGVGSQEIVR